MKPEIKSLHSPDVFDLAAYQPNEKNNFGFLLEVEIGILGQEGADLFFFMICTSEWFTNFNKNKNVVFGSHYIFMFEYDYTILRNVLLAYIDNIEQDTWTEIAAKLNRIGKWEFEDYKP